MVRVTKGAVAQSHPPSWIPSRYHQCRHQHGAPHSITTQDSEPIQTRHGASSRCSSRQLHFHVLSRVSTVPCCACAHRPTGNRRNANVCVIFCHRIDIKTPRARAKEYTLLIIRRRIRRTLSVIAASSITRKSNVLVYFVTQPPDILIPICLPVSVCSYISTPLMPLDTSNPRTHLLKFATVRQTILSLNWLILA